MIPRRGVDLNYIPRNPLDGTLLLQLLGMDRFGYQWHDTAGWGV